ncbi:hypothetical protein GCM10010404_60250 [Nonomuraea africana]
MVKRLPVSLTRCELTAAEAESLFLTGLPTAADLGLGAEVAAAQLEVLAALPADLRDRAFPG